MISLFCCVVDLMGCWFVTLLSSADFIVLRFFLFAAFCFGLCCSYDVVSLIWCVVDFLGFCTGPVFLLAGPIYFGAGPAYFRAAPV